MRDMHPPTSRFQKCLGKYSFFIILSLFRVFDSNKLYALINTVENVRTKCIIFREALRIRGKNFKQSLAENYSKSTEIAITACKFSKFPGEHAPGSP